MYTFKFISKYIYTCLTAKICIYCLVFCLPTTPMVWVPRKYSPSMWPPLVISWCMALSNTCYNFTTTINPIATVVVNQLSYLGGPTLFPSS